MKSNILIIEYIARFTLAFVFLFHGLVPKIFWLSPLEIMMVKANDLPFSTQWVIYCGALLDVITASFLVVVRNRRWPIFLAVGVLIALLINVAIFSPWLLVEAFNPVTLNMSAIALCFITLVAMKLRQQLAKPQKNSWPDL